MTIPTLSAPHGIPPRYTCPHCFEEFIALFLFYRHVRDRHPSPTKPL